MVASENYKDELRRIISVLSGTEEIEFSEERELRLLQFKRWLTCYPDNDDDVFYSAAVLYSAISVSRQISEHMQDQSDLGFRPSASKSLAVLNRRQSFARLVEFLFQHDEGAYHLFHVPHYDRLAFDKRGIPESRKIAGLEKYTELCLRVKSSSKFRDPKSKAMQLYMAESKINVNIATDIKSNLADRRQKLSFLYVASFKRFRGITRMEPRLVAMDDLLARDAKKRDGFRDYIAHCAYVKNAIEHAPEISGEELAQWANVEPKFKFPITPLTQDELDAMGKASEGS